MYLAIFLISQGIIFWKLSEYTLLKMPDIHWQINHGGFLLYLFISGAILACILYDPIRKYDKKKEVENGEKNENNKKSVKRGE